MLGNYFSFQNLSDSHTRIRRDRDFFFPLIFFYIMSVLNFFNLICTLSTFSADSIIRVLINHRLTNFSNGIECEKLDENPTRIFLFFHELNLLDSLTQFAGPSTVHTGNPPVPGSDWEREIGRERNWERRVMYVNDLPLLSAKGWQFTWFGLDRVSKATSWRISLSHCLPEFVKYQSSALCKTQLAKRIRRRRPMWAECSTEFSIGLRPITDRHTNSLIGYASFSPLCNCLMQIFISCLFVSQPMY